MAYGAPAPALGTAKPASGSEKRWCIVQLATFAESRLESEITLAREEAYKEEEFPVL